MLFELLWILLCAAVSCGLLLAYRQGVKDGQRLAAKEPIASPHLPRPMTRGERTATPAQLRTQTLLENMERYDGSENGQKEVAP